MNAVVERPLEEDTSLRPKQRRVLRSGTDLMEIVESLPACSRCRDRRIKCHRQLPACRECHRARYDCAFFDPVRLENIPLRYVYELDTRSNWVKKLNVSDE